MSDDEEVFQGGSDAIRRFAELKNVPVSKVLRNALKDWIYAAYQTTPEAPKISPNPWAYLPGRGTAKGKVVKINLQNLPALEAVRLSPYRLARPNRGFALSAFVPLFQDSALEFTTVKKRSGTDGKKLARQSKAFAKTGGGDAGFKSEVESYRRSKSEGMTERDFAQAKKHEAPNFSAWEATINEIRLDQYPGWSDRASAAGYERAAKNIMVNLEKEMDRLWQG